MAPLPLLKLGFLLVKQASKPLSKRIAAGARQSSLFKNYVCMPIAQIYHFYEVRLKMSALKLGGGKVTKVPKLSETKAVEQGSEMLAEVIILGIASSLLIYEYNRSSEKDQAKEAKLKADREMIKTKIFELENKMEQQSMQIRSLAKTAIHLEEEVQKRGLRGVKMQLLGENCKVPGELEATLRDIPEEPRLVTPLQLQGDQDDDLQEGEDQDKVANATEDSVKDEKTPIQKLVEERFARPSTEEAGTLPKPEPISVVEEPRVEEKLSSKVTDSIDYLLDKAFPVKEGVMPSGSKESLVTGGLRHVVEGKAEDNK